MFQDTELYLKRTPLYDVRLWWRNKGEIARWERAGSPVPPPQCIKYRIIREYGRRHGIDTLIETGTAYGDAIHACRHTFRRIVSIELGAELHRRAAKRFRGLPHIIILNGDSGELLPRVLNEIDDRAVIWLDGHYSCGETARGELNTPILKELAAILAHRVRNHVVLIDDARFFTGAWDYPTVSAVQQLVQARCPGSTFAVEHDIIRIELA